MCVHRFVVDSRTLFLYNIMCDCQSGMRSMNTISAIVGLDTKATMDLDKTIKEFTLKHEANRKILTETCTVQIADDIQFEVVGISDIRETDDYPSIRVVLKANYSPIGIPLMVDVTTGNMITLRDGIHFLLAS